MIVDWSVVFVVIFFFQAEDGIRDLTVTGVQTCALPILTPHKNHAAVIRAAARLEPKTTVRIIGRGPERASLERLAATLGVACSIESDLKIGRASCRERV